MSEGNWTPFPQQPLKLFHSIDIYPGEGEDLRSQRLAEFGQLYRFHKARNSKYQVKVEGFHDRGTWTEEWVRGRRTWIYWKLFQASNISQPEIALAMTFDTQLGGVVRVNFSGFDFRLPGISLSDGPILKSSDESTQAAIDPRCRPIEGLHVPMPRRRIELEFEGKETGSDRWVKLGEKFTVELEDGVNGFEKVEAAFKPYALEISKHWGSLTDIKIAGKTVFQAEFDHMKQKQWHTEMAAKIKLQLTATLRLPGGVTAKIGLDAFMKDPKKWITEEKYKGGFGLTIDFEF